MIRIHRYTLTEELLRDAHVALYRGHEDGTGRRVLAKVLVDEHPSVTQLAWLRHEHAIELELDLDGVVRPIGLDEHGHGLI